MRLRLSKKDKMNKIILVISLIFLISCKKEAKFISKANNIEDYEIEPNDPNKKVYGNWVGNFISKKVAKNNDFSKVNKINIVIQKIENGNAYGYILNAGKFSHWEGKVNTISNGNLQFEVNESDKNNDNEKFSFVIQKDTVLGSWSASNKKTDVKEKSFVLTKKQFAYNPKLILSKRVYIDFYTKIKNSKNEEIMDTYRYSESNISDLNASMKILKESELKNLKKLDLELIRNTIYARHGYSFKNIVYGQFFDHQDWYVPVSDDISGNLTSIEKQNIKTLERFEKYATDNYEGFGR